MKKAFVFPGQGSQFVGMGKEVAEAFPIARHVFKEVDDALSQHLSKLIFEGPGEELTLTENTQPALMAVSIALLRVLQEQGGLDLAKDCSFIAGHSLGEYTALAAGQSISLADTARLLRIRGNAMQAAVPFGEGAMAAILGSDVEAAQLIAEEAACEIANDNAPGQVVLSGKSTAIDRAIAIATESGKKSVRLAVSAPFHSKLMAPAAKVMEEALAEIIVHKPVVPLIANITAAQVTDPNEIRKLLVQQVVGRVRWRESMLYMKELGVDTIIEIGAGKVLTGLCKRIDKELIGISIQTPADIEAFLG